MLEICEGAVKKYNIDFKNIDEVLKLLRGEYPLTIHHLEAFEPLPTNTSQVMIYYIYSKKSNKKIFEEALTLLMNGSAADLFLGFIYFDECLYYEKENLASFNIHRNKFLFLLRKRLSENLDALGKGVTYVNGETNTDALRYIKVTDEYWREVYGFGVLE